LQDIGEISRTQDAEMEIPVAMYDDPEEENACREGRRSDHAHRSLFFFAMNRYCAKFTDEDSSLELLTARCGRSTC
jgi:hypothetical protein